MTTFLSFFAAHSVAKAILTTRDEKELLIENLRKSFIFCYSSFASTILTGALLYVDYISGVYR
jgi:hypothetical protein